MHPAGAILKRTSFGALPGWASDDHAECFATFIRSAQLADSKPLRAARPADDRLLSVYRAAVATGPLAPAAARAFFERHFEPYQVSAAGFVTGYFEPVVAGARSATDRFSAPLLSPPLRHFRAPLPDRRAIERGALDGQVTALAYLDPVDLFMAHVQGSLCVNLDDGRRVRFTYAGRNGHPYVSIATILVARLGLSPSEMTADKLWAWLRAHPQEGRALMHENPSYIFFRPATGLESIDGPIGGAGVPLTPLRSLAVDRTVWSYGLPVYLETELPLPSGERQSFARLFVAQDTGSAIVGPARGDIFFGTGARAGARAALIREAAAWTVLLPADSLRSDARP